MSKAAVFLLGAAVAAFLMLALQERARLVFPNYDNIPEYHWAGDFKNPGDCREVVAYFTKDVPSMGARCDYAPRFRVWWLMLQNILFVTRV